VLNSCLFLIDISSYITHVVSNNGASRLIISHWLMDSDGSRQKQFQTRAKTSPLGKILVFNLSLAEFGYPSLLICNFSNPGICFSIRCISPWCLLFHGTYFSTTSIFPWHLLFHSKIKRVPKQFQVHLEKFLFLIFPYPKMVNRHFSS